MKPFAESCEQNKDVILQVIKPLLANSKKVLEIGSGTGQHAIHFGQAMAHLQWYTSERSDALDGIHMWLDDFDKGEMDLDNVHSPFELDVMQEKWPEIVVDAVFTANTFHIMHWNEVQKVLQKVPLLLENGGILLVYGPFNYNGQYTSASNRQFDGWLKERDPESGIRDFTELNELALKNGLQILADFEMPANNRILCWQKNTHP